MEILRKLFTVIVAVLLVLPVVFADDSPYGYGTSGLNPYGDGSSGLNPYGFGSGGLNPYGYGTSGLNPYGYGSSGLNPYGGSTTTGTTGTSNPVPNPTPSPNPNPSPGPTGGTTWATLSNQIIPEDAPVGTMVYPGLRNLCFDVNGVNIQVSTASTNFDLTFRNDDLVLNRLTANFNGQELVGLECNGKANSFVLSVSPVNDAPTFTSAPVTTATKNALYSYDANAVDIEGNAFTFALITSPFGMTIDSNSGLISWRPSSTGSQTVQIRVTDNQGASNNQAYTITVGSGGSGGGSSGGSSGTKDKHNIEIAGIDLDKTRFNCGESFKAGVSVANLGDFSEAVSIKIENKDLGIVQSKSTTIAKGNTEEVEFDLMINSGVNSGSYTLVSRLTSNAGDDYESRKIDVTCEKENEIEPVITTSEDKPKERNWLTIITLSLAILAAIALIVWFVLLLKDEFITTEKFI